MSMYWAYFSNICVFLLSTQSQYTPVEWQFKGSLFIIAIETPYIFNHYTVAEVNAFIAQHLPVQIRSEIRNVKVIAKCNVRDRDEEYGRNRMLLGNLSTDDGDARDDA